MMTAPLTRRTVTGALAGVACGLGLPSTAIAQAYPGKPIRLLVSFGTGSGNGLIASELSRQMSETLCQAVVVENRPVGGAVAT